MPKGHKRKNAGVGVDFKKAKHKVGKKLPQADNATDTTVKSSAINLPNQSVAVDKTGQAVTKRNLTLKEIISQCGHYSEKTRKDALLSLLELISTHPNELRAHAALILGTLAERFSDNDGPCRKTALDVFKTSILPTMGPVALQPFIPLLMAHICSAMTHLSSSIRSDGFLFLEALMQFEPRLVAAQYLPVVLQNFGHALSRSTRGVSLKAGSLVVLLSVVKGLQVFLVSATSALNTNDEYCSYSNSQGIGMRSRLQWPVLRIDSIEQDSTKAALEVLNLLLESWSDCESVDTDTSMQEGISADCGASILRCCDLILRHWGVELAGNLSLDKQCWAHKLLNKVAVRFPFQSSTGNITTNTQRHNLEAACLLCHFLPKAMQQQTSSKPHKSNAGVSKQQWTVQVLNWIESLFQHGAAHLKLNTSNSASGRNKDNGDEGDIKATAAAKVKSKIGSGELSMYVAVLQALQPVLPQLDTSAQQSILDSVFVLWNRTESSSPIRTNIITFLTTLFIKANTTTTRLTHNNNNTTTPVMRPQLLAPWLDVMPKFLWELGPSSPDTSSATLRLLLHVTATCTSSSNGTNDDEMVAVHRAVNDLGTQLPALFYIFLPSTSTTTGTKLGVRAGPLAQAPLELQNLAMDILCQLPEVNDGIVKVLAAVCLLTDYPLSLATRALQTLTLSLSNTMSSSSTGGPLLKAARDKFASLVLTVLAARNPRGGFSSSSKKKQLEEVAFLNRYMGVLSVVTCAALSCWGAEAAVQTFAMPLMSLFSHSNDGIAMLSTLGLVTLCTRAAAISSDNATTSTNMLPVELVNVLPTVMLSLLSTSHHLSLLVADMTDTVRVACIDLLVALPSLVQALAAAIVEKVSQFHTTTSAADEDDNSTSSLVSISQLLVTAVRHPQLVPVMTSDSNESTAICKQAFTVCNEALQGISTTTNNISNTKDLNVEHLAAELKLLTETLFK